MRTKLTTMIAAFAVLAAPGVALAGDNAAVEEYVLDIPGAGGKQHGDEPGAGSGDSGLSPAAAAALEAQGEDGIAAAELAKATGPRSNAPGDGRKGEAGSDLAVGAPDPDDSGIAEVLADLASGSGSGMGPALPILLALALVGAVALAIRRRRRETSPQS